MSRPDAIHHVQAGFTLVELLVAMLIASFMTILILGFTLDFWGSMGVLSSDEATFVERENAGDRLRTLFNVTSKFINQNSISDSHPMAAADSSHWELLHAVPTTIVMPASGSYAPVFYFTAPSVNASKSFIMNGASPYYDEFVLYLNGTTKQLVLRQLANPGASGDTVITSCPAAAASSSCPADVAISGDLTSVDTNYYSRSGNIINYQSSTDPDTGEYNGPDFPNVEVVQLTLHFSRRATINGAAPSISQIVVRVAPRN